MKSYTDYLFFNTKKRRDLINITDKLESFVEESGVKEGICLVSAMHITAGIWVNDNEKGLWEDLWELLEHLAPFKENYQHHLTGEDNGDAHLKRTLTGYQATLPVTKGKLDLGPWVLNVQNGTIMLATGELYEHSKGDRITKLIDTKYDPKAECPTWYDFLDKIFGRNESVLVINT